MQPIVSQYGPVPRLIEDGLVDVGVPRFEILSEIAREVLGTGSCDERSKSNTTQSCYQEQND